MPSNDDDIIDPPEPTRGTAREIEIERLAEERDARMVADNAAAEREAAGLAPEVVKPEVATPAPATPIAEQIARQMRRVKVDGEEFDVSDDDLVASYQKQAAATRRLQEADRILADARSQAEQIKSKPLADEDRAAKVKEYHEALFVGEAEKAATLFDELQAGRPTATPDVNQVYAQVMPAVRQQLSAESALASFERDYKDIIDDPYLTSVAQGHLRRMEAEGKPYAEALMTAGAQTRDWLKAKVSSFAPEKPTTTTRAEKLDKKAGIINFPTTSAIAHTNEDPDESPTDIIEAMKKARGQA